MNFFHPKFRNASHLHAVRPVAGIPGRCRVGNIRSQKVPASTGRPDRIVQGWVPTRGHILEGGHGCRARVRQDGCLQVLGNGCQLIGRHRGRCNLGVGCLKVDHCGLHAAACKEQEGYRMLILQACSCRGKIVSSWGCAKLSTKGWGQGEAG